MFFDSFLLVLWDFHLIFTDIDQFLFNIAIRDPTHTLQKIPLEMEVALP